MKPAILLLAVFIAALSSCTTSYKTGQTPDDVYYSPARPLDENVMSEKQDDRQTRNDDEYYDDRYLRMKVHNRTRWSDLNDWYSYDRYSSGYNYSYGSYNNPYNSWNYYYNPYCCCHTNNIYSNPKTSYTYTKPRTFNLSSYNNVTPARNSYSGSKYNNFSSSSGNNTYNGARNNSSSNNSNSGNILRSIFKSSSSGSSGNNSSNNSSGNNNNSSSSGSSGSSSGSSGSSTAPVRRF